MVSKLAVSPIDKLAIAPIVGQAIGLGEFAIYGSQIVVNVAILALKKLTEFYYYMRGKEIALFETQVKIMDLTDKLSDQVYRLFLSIITIVPPILGGAIRCYIINAYYQRILKIIQNDAQKELRAQKVESAITKFSEAASLGSATANYELYHIYLFGYDKYSKLGYFKNHVDYYQKKAIDCLKAAANLGHGEAQNNLGNLYNSIKNELADRFVKGDSKKLNQAYAIKLYKRAARQGSIHACLNLGEIHRQGKGVAKSEEVAQYFFNKADGLFNPHDFIEGIKEEHPIEYLDAMLRGKKPEIVHLGEACFALAKTYEKGDPAFKIEADRKKAIFYYTKAAELHKYELARIRLKLLTAPKYVYKS